MLALDAGQRKELKIALNYSLWQKGYLRHILQPAQKTVYDFYKDCEQSLIVFNCARQFGKSVLLLTLAFEECLAKDNVVVLFVAPTAKQAGNILKQKIKTVLDTMPQEMRPRVNKADGEVYFNNGSMIVVTGVEKDSGDRARGTTAHLVILDEAAFMSNLSSLVDDTFSPMTSRTGGKIIISSTPPHTQAHDFPDYCFRAQALNSYIQKTIYESDRTPEQIKLEEDKYAVLDAKGNIITPGTESPSFQIEYMCNMVTDKSKMIVPEWTDVREHVISKEYERPNFFTAYVVADWGFKDKTAILFAYYDFRTQCIVVEDELLLDNMVSTDIADLIVEKRDELWPEQDPDMIEYYCDHDLNIMGEIRKKTGISFRMVAKRITNTHSQNMTAPTNKFRDASVNDLRANLRQATYTIDPKCVNTIRQLDHGVWDIDKDTGMRKGFTRNEKLGHCDLLAALVYLNWSIKWNENPFPEEKPNIQKQFVPEHYYEEEDELSSLSRREIWKRKGKR